MALIRLLVREGLLMSAETSDLIEIAKVTNADSKEDEVVVCLQEMVNF
jgi:hypothetical protein